MSFKEHNNRDIAKKFAEYVTGKELREYLAEKVRKYVKEENLIIFDGAIGSGQLEQYMNPSMLYGVDVQEMSVLTARENYKNTDIEIKSFFYYDRKDFIADVVVMNPPFSLKFNDLSDKEKENIQEEFNWKKSGVVDDIFVLKSLKYTKRYGFYILFPGVGYRRTEEKFRQEIGNKLIELNIIRNAFEDTSIDVLFIVIDKGKADKGVRKEIYDCKLKKIIYEETGTVLSEDSKWEHPKEEIKTEEVNIAELNKELKETVSKVNFLRKEIDNIVEDLENEFFKEFDDESEEVKISEKQLKLF